MVARAHKLVLLGEKRILEIGCFATGCRKSLASRSLSRLSTSVCAVKLRFSLQYSNFPVFARILGTECGLVVQKQRSVMMTVGKHEAQGERAGWQVVAGGVYEHVYSNGCSLANRARNSTTKFGRGEL